MKTKVNLRLIEYWSRFSFVVSSSKYFSCDPVYSLLLLLVLPFLSAFHDASSQTSIDALRQAVQQKLAEQKGVYAVAFKDLKTGETLFINEQMSYHAASTMKTPVLVEVFNQVKQGKIS